MAIAIPAYLAQQQKAQDTKTKQYLNYAYRNIRSALPETNNVYQQSTSLVGVVQASEPELTISSGDCLGGLLSSSPNTLIVDSATTPNSLNLCAKSQSGNIWKLNATSSGQAQLTDASVVPLSFSGNEITDALRLAGVKGDGIPPPDSSTGVWTGTTNQFPNGGFESNSTGWVASTTGGDAVISTSTAHAKFGSSSLKIQASTGTLNAPRSTSWNWLPSTTYVVSGWFYLESVGAGVTSIRLSAIYNSPQASIGTSLNLSKIGQWQYLSATFTTDSGSQAGTYIDMPRINGTLAGNTVVYVDGIQIEQAQQAATPYVETNGGTASRNSSRIQVSMAGMSPAQGWVALRFRTEWTSATPPRGGAAWDWLWRWGTNSSPRYTLDLLYRESASFFDTETWVNDIDVSSPNTPVQTIAPGNLYTVVSYWTSTQTGISVNGGAFTTMARGSYPTLAQLTPTADIGSAVGGAPCDCEVLWYADGMGTLTNGDASTINGFGNNDPSRSSLPGNPRLVWDGTSGNGSLK
jgi:hypothetical protein